MERHALENRLPGAEGVPLHLRLREQLILRLRSGEWVNEERIPAERTLCEMFGVSRITVRQALEALQREGWIERRQGSGTIVRIPGFEQRLDSFYSFDDEIRRAGSVPSSRVLDLSVLPCTVDWAEKLGVPEGEPVLILDRLRLADGQPCASERSVVPLRYTTGITRERIEQKGLYASMRECSGIMPGKAVETIRAVALSVEQASCLGTKKGSPALMVDRVAEWNGLAVEFCRSFVRSDKYAFRIELGS